MPKHPTESSTQRRHKLADFLDSKGSTMVNVCSTCKKHQRVCKVHIRSGKCNECVRRGQRCDIKVTKSEFDRLRAEKEKLQAGIEKAKQSQQDAYRALEAAQAASLAAQEASRIAYAKEMRLRQQMDLIDRRADDAISVELANIEELEQEETAENATLSFPEPSVGFALSPTTWGALEGFPDEFWELPGFPGSGGTAQEAGGSS